MKHTKLDWTKPLQTTDGVKAELVYTSKHNKEWPYLVLLDGEEKWVRDDGFNINFQIINTPETKLVEFSINTYPNGLGISHDSSSEADRCKMPRRTNRIDFSMQLEPGKNYEVTGVKEVQ